MQEEDAKTTLVVGATFLGLGIALAANKKAVAVERSIMVGPEFICAYKSGTNWNRKRTYEKASQLEQEFVRRKIVGEKGNVHIPGMQPVLYNFVKQERLDVNFSTQLIDIEKLDSCYEVTLYNASGMYKARFKNIVDTTNRCISDPKKEIQILGKSINALIHSKEGLSMPVKNNSDKTKFTQGNCKGEVVMQFFIDNNDDIVIARDKIHRFWQERPQFLENWSLDAIALECETQILVETERIDENWWWYPSSVYKNPIEAFEKGLEEGMQFS